VGIAHIISVQESGMAGLYFLPMQNIKKSLNRLSNREWWLSLFSRWGIGLLAVLAFVVFFELAEDVWEREIFEWDQPIIAAMENLRTPVLTIAMHIITEFGNWVAFAAAGIAVIYFFKKKRELDSWAMIVSLVGANVINVMLKLFLVRPRPDLIEPLAPASGFSFPSGHVTTAGAVFGFLAVILWRAGRRSWAVVCALVVAAVAVSRVYLGVHYPSDTLAALVFTILWLIVIFTVRDLYE
jgi:membrane-associated phospholipid phosphatase